MSLFKRRLESRDEGRSPKRSRADQEMYKALDRPSLVPSLKRGRDEEPEDERNVRSKKDYRGFVLDKLRLDLEPWVKRLREAKAERDESLRIRTRVEITLDDLRDQRMSDGDIRLAKIRKMLDEVPGFPRSEHQKEFHDAFIAASLPHIFKSSWEANSVRVLESLGLTRVQYEVLIMTARRWGKTISVAMFDAVMLLCCPGIKIAVFSTGKRASGSLMGEIVRMIHRLGFANRIVKHNQEELYVASVALEAGSGAFSKQQLQSAADTSRLGSFPSTTAGLQPDISTAAAV